MWSGEERKPAMGTDACMQWFEEREREKQSI
jgi:hypothetical protein